MHPTTQQPTLITLHEFESLETALAQEAYSALRTRYSGRIDVTPTDRAGVYRLAARDFVGRIALPGGVLLVIKPKVAVANLFYMLCAEAGLAEFNPPPTNLESNRDAADIARFVVAALLDAIDKLLARGIYRGYVAQEAGLEAIRGRILIGKQVSRYAELKHRHVCSYAELTADTPENRITATALRIVPVLLGQGEQDRLLVQRARAQARKLGEAGPVSRTEAIGLLNTISLHRLNLEYGSALALCRLLLQRLSFDEKPGRYPFASFLVDMPRLFESFLTVRLCLLLRQHGLHARAQQSDYLDVERTVGIRPDLLVYGKATRQPLLVLDFKYRRMDEPGAGHNTDLYQLSAYMDRYSLHAGFLVYPQFASSPPSHLNVRGTPKQIHLATIDLAAPTPAELDEECERLVSKIVSET